MKKPELMAPAGDWPSLTAAINAGADAVYFGLDGMNMRAASKNFKINDLKEIVDFCKNRGVKSYLTLNIIFFDKEQALIDKALENAQKAGVDMIICWDFSVIEKCNNINIPFCVSTQASVSNSYAVNYYGKLGAKRIVLARECSLDEIKEIKRKTNVEIEAFIHGAMCVAISGRCFMSHHLFGKSANRGECIQPCRRDYLIYDDEIDQSLLLGEDYIMSPNDLCSIEFIDKLIEAKIDAFKIEGRKRSPEYVQTVVATYRKAIDLYFENKLTDQIKKEFLENLRKVYNRGFSSGFYFDLPSSDDYANIYGSLAVQKKIYVGKIINYFKKSKIAHAYLEAGNILSDSEILIQGKTTGVVETKLNGFMVNDKARQKAEKGDEITFYCETSVKANDLLYKIEKK